MPEVVGQRDERVVQTLAAYQELAQAVQQQDAATLKRLANTKGEAAAFVRFRAFRALSFLPRLPAKARLRYWDEVLSYRLTSPLAREAVRWEQLRRARLAEAAGLDVEARKSYREALPLKLAVAGLRRLEPHPTTLARNLLDAREAEAALQALKGVRAPLLRADILRAAGEYPLAATLYTGLLRRNPQNQQAREGLFYTRLEEEKFQQAAKELRLLPADPWQQIALAEAQEKPAEALASYLEVKDAYSLWQAAGVLEQQGKSRQALKLYLELATETDASEAAFRALTLARRLRDSAAARQALKNIAPNSFFGLLVQRGLRVPNVALAPAHPPVLARAKVLAQAGVRADRAAAIGELRLALRRAASEAQAVAIAEALQGLGEYAVSSEAARVYVEAGSRARRTWQVAFPLAYKKAVLNAAKAHNVDPSLVWAVMQQESHFYPLAHSTSAATGLMQIVPTTWDWLAELQGEAPASAYDAARNIRYGSFYIAHLLAMFEGDAAYAVAAYNGGPGYVADLLAQPLVRNKNDFYRFIDRSETRLYVQKVLLNQAVYQMLYPSRGGEL